MALTKDTVAKVAHLARIKVGEDRLPSLAQELDAIVAWVEQLGEVDTDGVTPMASAVDMRAQWRTDAVTDGGDADRAVSNAPDRQGDYFAVPKVVE
jgi:aspartyl-tRNA(Asn)/glutamyl-tRNA(Gln) amidotransferase subunit C